MPFEPSIEKIRDIVERRLIRVDDQLKKNFPDVLNVSNVHWISFGNDSLLSLIFVTENDLDRIRSYETKNFEPFPGLFTTDGEAPAAFFFEKKRFVVARGNKVVDGISFLFGADTTLIVIDHKQELNTKELGKITYTIPLGYFISFGEDVSPDNVYERLDELVAFSVNMWRESRGG